MSQIAKEVKAPVLAVLLFVQERKLVTPTELQNEFHLSVTSMSQTINRWLKRGLIERALRIGQRRGKEVEVLWLLRVTKQQSTPTWKRSS